MPRKRPTWCSCRGVEILGSEPPSGLYHFRTLHGDRVVLVQRGMTAAEKKCGHSTFRNVPLAGRQGTVQFFLPGCKGPTRESAEGSKSECLSNSLVMAARTEKYSLLAFTVFRPLVLAMFSFSRCRGHRPVSSDSVADPFVGLEASSPQAPLWVGPPRCESQSRRLR